MSSPEHLVLNLFSVHQDLRANVFLSGAPLGQSQSADLISS
jgi:hypothetical protein